MNLADTLILVAIAAAVAAIIAWIIRRKKRGKTGCGCCQYREKCADKVTGN